jgi:hypothetical protein
MLARSSGPFDEPYLNTRAPARNAKRRKIPVESFGFPRAMVAATAAFYIAATGPIREST